MRNVEPHMPEGLGVWYLRFMDTGETVPDHGPYIAHKSALKGARQMNGIKEPAPAIEPLGPEATVAKEIEEMAKAPKKVRKAPVTVEEPEAPAIQPGTSKARHEWIEDAAQFALDIVSRAGGVPTSHIRVTLGWPLLGRKFAGECWHGDASSDGAREIFVAPSTNDGAAIVGTLVHELCHACLPHDVKHGPKFKALGAAAGLTGKPTHMAPGEDLQALILEWIEEHGAYPAGSLDRTTGRKKQSTRLIKAECPDCGYTIRTTRKWIATAHPHCPDPDCVGHDTPMTVDGGDEEGE